MFKMFKKRTKATLTAAPCSIEPLEDRRLLAAFGTMNVIDAGTGPAAVVSYTVNGTKDFAEAGVYKWTRSATSPGTFPGKPAAGAAFDAFCLEPDQEFPSLPNVAYTVVDLASAPPETSPHGKMGVIKANQVRELWGRFRAAVGTDNTKAAAFQMALWEIVADSGKNLAGGAFVADTSNATGLAIKNQAQAWLDQVNGQGPKANLLALTSPCDQDQVFEIPPNPKPPCKPDDCKPPKNDDCKPPKKDKCDDDDRDDCKQKKDKCKPHKNDCKPPKKDDCKPPRKDDCKNDRDDKDKKDKKCKDDDDRKDKDDKKCKDDDDKRHDGKKDKHGGKSGHGDKSGKSGRKC